MVYDMDNYQFLKEIANILLDVLSVDDLGIEITMSTELISSLGPTSLALSSIDYVDFLVCVENKYDIVCDFDARFYTIRDVYDYIMKQKEIEEISYE